MHIHIHIIYNYYMIYIILYVYIYIPTKPRNPEIQRFQKKCSLFKLVLKFLRLGLRWLLLYIWFMPPRNMAKLGMDPIADIAEYSHNIRNRIVEVD